MTRARSMIAKRAILLLLGGMVFRVGPAYSHPELVHWREVTPEDIAAAEAKLDAQPDDYQAATRLVYLYLIADRLDEAEREANRALTLPAKAGDHSDARRYLAEVLLERGDVDGAIAGMREAARQAALDHEAWYAWLRLGEILQYYRQKEQSQEAYERSLNSWFTEGTLQSSMMGLAQVNRDGQRLWLRLAAAVDSWYGDYPPSRAERMIQILEPLREAYGDRAILHRVLSRLYERIEEGEKATEAARQAVQVEPDNWTCHLRLAERLEEEGRRDEAAEELQEVLRTAGRLKDVAWEAHDRLSSIYAEAGDPEAAFEHYKQALGTTEDGWSVFRLVDLALQAGKPADALSFLQENESTVVMVDVEAMDLLPSAVAMLNAHLGNVEAMRDALRELVSAEDVIQFSTWYGEILRDIIAAPDAAAVAYWLGVLAHDTRKFAEAKSWLGKALEAAPDLVAANILLANILADEDPERAAALAQRAMEKAAPGSKLRETAEQTLKRIEAREENAQ